MSKLNLYSVALCAVKDHGQMNKMSFLSVTVSWAEPGKEQDMENALLEQCLLEYPLADGFHSHEVKTRLIPGKVINMINQRGH